MKVLIVSQHFWPENFLINDLVSGLIDRQHTVTVLTGIPNYPSGKFFDGYHLFSPNEEFFHGARVVRVPVFPRREGRPWQIVLNYLSYAVSASLFSILRIKNPFDVILVFEVSPVTQGIPAVFLKKRLKIPLLFWVQDLWPESLSATGAVKSTIILNQVKKLVRWIYGHSNRVLVQSQAFHDSILKVGGVKEKQIEYLPNWTESFYQPVKVVSNEKVLQDMPQGFKAVFAGNIGLAQSLETILNAAEILRAQREIKWVILGDGSQYTWLKEEVKRRELDTQVTLLGRRPAEMMPEYFALSEVLLVTLKPEPIFAFTIPSKVSSYMACGRPIIAALDGEGARVIKEAKAGYCVPAGNAEALAKAVMEMSFLSESQRKIMGENGRIYYQNNFERESMLDRLEMIMQSVQSQEMQ